MEEKWIYKLFNQYRVNMLRTFFLKYRMLGVFRNRSLFDLMTMFPVGNKKRTKTPIPQAFTMIIAS